MQTRARLVADHRQIAGRVQEGVRPCGSQLVTGAKSPQHTDSGHAVGAGTGDVDGTIAHHDGTAGINLFLVENVGDHVRFLFAGSIQFGTVNRREIMVE